MAEPDNTRPQPFINIGKVRMTLQAFIVLMVGIVMALGAAAVGAFTRSFKALFGSLILLAIFMIISYIVNCTVVGKCVILSWILVVFYILYAIVILGGGFVVGNMMSKLGNK
jgi:hypothetical protein